MLFSPMNTRSSHRPDICGESLVTIDRFPWNSQMLCHSRSRGPRKENNYSVYTAVLWSHAVISEKQLVVCCLCYLRLSRTCSSWIRPRSRLKILIMWPIRKVIKCNYKKFCNLIGVNCQHSGNVHENLSNILSPPVHAVIMNVWPTRLHEPYIGAVLAAAIG